MAQAGRPNHGEVVFYLQPHDPRIQPLEIHVMETDTSKLTVDVQRRAKRIFRILVEHNWFAWSMFSDADSCTSVPHRVYYSLRDLVRGLLVQLWPGADPEVAVITLVTLHDTCAFLHMMGVFNGHDG
jgi:hypothetical protein